MKKEEVPRSNGWPIEVFKDGHLMFTFGYSGPGPIAECIELLGDALAGCRLRTTHVDLTGARLLAYAGVVTVDAAWVTRSARRVLEAAGVEVSGDTTAGSGPGAEPSHDVRELLAPPIRGNLGWTA